jgi:hypothetical protein
MFKKENMPKKIIILKDNDYFKLFRKKIDKSLFNQLHQWLVGKFH